MIRIGVDFGGTKIEAAAIDPEGQFRARVRAPTPRDYAASLAAVRDLVEEAERQAGGAASGRRFVGVATPGSISPKTGLIRNANSQWLNGTPFREDLATTLGAPVRMANDANCLALSEATDGAAAVAAVVFAAILGTGCGGGVVTHGRVVAGANSIAGEWGHAPLPWPQADEHPGALCWCGRRGCLELYVSGTGFEADHLFATGRKLPGLEIAAAARQGDPQAGQALDRYVDRLGRGLAMICNIIDPDVIVLGGGMSNVPELYARVPAAIARWIFSDVCATPVVAARFGDSSGVRGAALLWGVDEMQ
ncbi:MAG TPA: ROK family protein [Xanthobacteraceae bacterium]|nr:ROK family protein [Xanthobacteraceae bacterium]